MATAAAIPQNPTFQVKRNKQKLVSTLHNERSKLYSKVNPTTSKTSQAAQVTRPFENLSNAVQGGGVSKLPKFRKVIPVTSKRTLRSSTSKVECAKEPEDVDVAKKTLPAGVVDIDKETGHLLEPVYAQDVMKYLRGLELKFSLSESFLKGRQTTPSQRSVLVDWLIQVVDHLRLKAETMHLTVQILDLYLDRKPLETKKLQLLGVTCLLIAAKYIERFAPEIDELVRMTDNSYRFGQVIVMEQLLLQSLDFNLHLPEPSTFLDRTLLAAGAGKSTTYMSKVASIARYLLDLGLIDATFSSHEASIRAAACVTAALKIKAKSEGESTDIWTPTLTYYTGFLSQKRLQAAVKILFKCLSQAATSKCKGARQLHSSESRHNKIALWWALEPTFIEKNFLACSAIPAPTPSLNFL